MIKPVVLSLLILALAPLAVATSQQDLLCQESFNPAGAKPPSELKAFSQAMTEGLLLHPHQEDLFEFYKRIYFGDYTLTFLENSLADVHAVLRDHPELKKPHFREYEIVLVQKIYDSPESLDRLLRSLNANAGKIRSNLFIIDANIGFWKKLFGFSDPVYPPGISKIEKIQIQDNFYLKFYRYFNRLISYKNRELLKDDMIDYRLKIKTLYAVFNQLLKQQTKNGRNTQFLRQAIVDLIATTGFNNKATQELLKSKNAIERIEGLYKILSERDSMAMELGFTGHFKSMLEILNIEAPSFLGKTIDESKQIFEIEQEILNGHTKVLPVQKIRVRSLSIQEAPFRSCLGGSDCSSRTYFKKALDPNFNYFTMTNSENQSTGQATVVLGSAKDKAGSIYKIAFVDKIQNIPNRLIKDFLQAISLSVSEKGYRLALPKDVGDHNGLSNMDSTRQYVESEVIKKINSEPLVGFEPHPHQYYFENMYSRAYLKPLLVLFEPLSKSTDVEIHPGFDYQPKWANPETDARSLVQELLTLKNSNQDRDILKYIAGGETIKALNNAQIFNEFINNLDMIVRDKNLSLKVRKQALFESLLLSQNEDLILALEGENFSAVEKTQIVSELKQLNKSADKRKLELHHKIRNLIITALKYNNITVAKALLDMKLIEINESFHNKTPLMLAAEQSSVPMIKFLLSYPNISVNQKNTFGITALMCSVNRSAEIVATLLSHPELDVNAKNESATSALLDAIRLDNVPVVKILLSHPQINVSHWDSKRNTGLMIAAHEGFLQTTDMLLNHQATDPNAADKWGDTSLIKAAKSDKSEIIKRLLADKRTDINLSNRIKRYNALMAAIERNSMDAIKTLLESKTLSINAQDRYGRTALILASQKGQRETVNLLLNNPGINLSLKTNKGLSAYQIASLNGHTGIALKLAYHAAVQKIKNSGSFFGFH
jgi:ankyrin repeat protein